MNKPDWLPHHCEGCNEDAYCQGTDPEQSLFLVCQGCGGETTFVWCPRCGMGGPFVRDTAGRPGSWVCPDCNREYALPDGFYRTPVKLYPEGLHPENPAEESNRRERMPLYIKILIVLACLGWGLLLMQGLLWFIDTARHP